MPPNISKQQKQALKNLERSYYVQQQKQRQDEEATHRAYNLTKATHGAITDLLHEKKPLNALARSIYTGVKLAQPPENSFYDELASPLALTALLKKLGPTALTWSPETLCAVIDEQFGGWTKSRIEKALEHFHTTGELDTRVPDLVRQKLYALRIVITSDTAHNFWEVFEKVGCAFNDRLANFSVVQALSASECARTIAIIQNVRPDQYSREVRIYVAACCHQDGLYTVSPSKWLGAFNPELQEFNQSATGAEEALEVTKRIKGRYTEYKSSQVAVLEDSTESIQAAKLLGIDEYANEALKS